MDNSGYLKISTGITEQQKRRKENEKNDVKNDGESDKILYNKKGE